MKSKRMRFTFYNDEVIEFIDALPRGYRSSVMESAMLAYVRTGGGKKLIRKPGKPETAASDSRVKEKQPETKTKIEPVETSENEFKTEIARLKGFLDD